MKEGDKVRFVRPSHPMEWSDIRAEYADLLQDGHCYEVTRVETHSWHTKVYLRGFAVPFNSVWFEEICQTSG